MPVQLFVALLRNEDNEWIEPNCCCYERQLVSFDIAPQSARVLTGKAVFKCYAAPGENPNLTWKVTHLGVMPFAGGGKPIIRELPSPLTVKHGDTFNLDVSVPASVAALDWPQYDPIMRYA